MNINTTPGNTAVSTVCFPPLLLFLLADGVFLATSANAFMAMSPHPRYGHANLPQVLGPWLLQWLSGLVKLWFECHSGLLLAAELIGPAFAGVLGYASQ